MRRIDSQPDILMSAIWSAFPSIEYFRNFKQDSRNLSIIERFAEVACRNGLIPQNNENEFEALLHRLAENYKDRKPSFEYTFELLIKDIKKDTSVKRLVADLVVLAGKFGFMKPDEVLFTRLKKDYHTKSRRKHHALMLLAIWLGIRKPGMGVNFKTLIGFPRYLSEMTEDEKTGIMAAFAFTGEGIDTAMIEFLNRELSVCIRDLNITYLNEKRIHHLATMCTARFPLKEGSAGFPSSYAEALHDALALAYQMMVTWQLSPLYTARVHFMIVLDGGVFDTLDVTFKKLLNPNLSADYSIRLSHFVFTAAGQAEAKIIMKHLEYPDVWAVEKFWAFPYFKSPPALMPSEKGSKDATDYLPVKADKVPAFRDAVFSGDIKDVPLLATISHYPPKVLLTLEIANILTLRRYHYEAIQLLSNVLSLDPQNCIARTLRLRNYMFLANAAKDLETAEILYERGIYDGEFVEASSCAEPQFYGEFGLIYWSRAIKIIRQLRLGHIKDHIPERQAEVFEYIRNAEHFAKKGTAVALEGLDSRSAFWSLYYAGFRRLLEDNPLLMAVGNEPFIDPKGLYYDAAKPYFRSIGWLVFKEGEDPYEEVDKRMSAAIGVYLKSISETSFYVNVLYSVSALIWDFSRPEKKKRIIDHVLLLLGIALRKTDELKKRCLGIYSVVLASPLIQSPEEFICCVKRAEQAIEDIKKTGDYETGLKLSLMHLDGCAGYEPITYDLICAEENKNRR